MADMYSPERLQAMQKELDLTINQRLNMTFTDRERGNHLDLVRRSISNITSDVSSFARFLSQSHCLEVLLFWKEVRFHVPNAWDGQKGEGGALALLALWLRPATRRVRALLEPASCAVEPWWPAG